MLIKRLDSNSFDVFWGNGWGNWARYSVEGQKLQQVKGIRAPFPVVVALKKRFKVE